MFSSSTDHAQNRAVFICLADDLYMRMVLHENVSQTFLIISGPAEIGKSVLVNIIEAILGEDNVTELHPERLRPLLLSKAQQKRAAEEQQLTLDFKD